MGDCSRSRGSSGAAWRASSKAPVACAGDTLAGAPEPGMSSLARLGPAGLTGPSCEPRTARRGPDDRRLARPGQVAGMIRRVS